MKIRLSAEMTGGLIGVAYFVVTMILAYSLSGGDQESLMVIAQLSNLHIAFLFYLLDFILPVSLNSQIMFQLIVGIFVNFLLGSGIGWIVKMIRSKKEK